MEVMLGVLFGRMVCLFVFLLDSTQTQPFFSAACCFSSLPKLNANSFRTISCPISKKRENKLFMLSHSITSLEWKRLSEEENLVEVGRVTHFFTKISVAVVELSAPLAVGDHIVIKGPTTDFEQVVESMQIEHQNIERAEAGQSIGLKVAQRVREKDIVYKKV